MKTPHRNLRAAAFSCLLFCDAFFSICASARLAMRVGDNGFLNPKPRVGFFQSPRDGRFYCWHFWLYPMIAAPLKIVLRAFGGNL